MYRFLLKPNVWQKVFWILSILWIVAVGAIAYDGKLGSPAIAEIQRKWAVAIFKKVKSEHPNFLNGLVPEPKEPPTKPGSKVETDKSYDYFGLRRLSWSETCEANVLTNMHCMVNTYYDKDEWSVDRLLQTTIHSYCYRPGVTEKPNKPPKDLPIGDELSLKDIILISGAELSIDCLGINQAYETNIRNSYLKFYAGVLGILFGPIGLVFICGRSISWIIRTVRQRRSWIIRTVRQRLRKSRMPDESAEIHYEQAWAEVNADNIRQGLWAQVYSANKGDVERTTASYIKARAQELRNAADVEAEQESAEKERYEKNSEDMTR